MYRISQHIYNYCASCISASANDIDDMVDNATQISYNTFIKYVSIEDLKSMFTVYAWGNKKGLKLKDDYAVSYYKSKYKGQPCLYIRHSSIEYVFCRSEYEN